MERGLFDIVIFDEASQLRLEDVYTCLLRGKFKIISGDKHQMPPSSYFLNTPQILLDGTNEDNENDINNDNNANNDGLILADSKSLLEFAENLANINRSYLDFHYRSNHPALINFSNNAFYGKNLIIFPPKEDYTPIEFRQINGLYENNSNIDEVNEVVNILKNETDEAELIQFLDVISTNVTFFYREAAHFKLLSEIMKKWYADGQRQFRIWCAAASSARPIQPWERM